jgi:RNA polymerase sigma factor (sigma-70 family)
VQDTLVQAWRGVSGFEGRASVRSWLYRIATNTCLARRAKDERRRRLVAATTVHDGVAVPVPVTVPWLQAVPQDAIEAVAQRDPHPGERLIGRESLEIAFVAALQHLTDRQCAVLVLRDVAGWSAKDVAEQLKSSTHTGRWHTGEFFLIQDERAQVGDHGFDPLSVLGVDPETGRYVMRTFDNGGYHRQYELTVDGNRWTITGATERAEITFSDDNRRQTIRWEWKPANAPVDTRDHRGWG